MEQEGRDLVVVEEQGGQERKRGAEEEEEETDGGHGDGMTCIKQSQEDVSAPSRSVSSIPENSHDGDVSTGQSAVSL